MFDRLCVNFIAIIVLTSYISPSYGLETQPDPISPTFIPTPRSLGFLQGRLVLTETSAIAFEDDALKPLADVVAEEIEFAFGRRVSIKKRTAVAGDIVLRLIENTKAEEYSIDIGETATVSGGNYQAVALGTTTLLQAMQVSQGRIELPKLKIIDAPATEFRSVLIDLCVGAILWKH
ncbi:MAG: glycoside hydrolase family 20 zincin-like fold domain-containing protein [Pirellulales bacterium]